MSLARDAGSTDLVVHEPSQPPQTLGEVDVVFPLLHGPWGEDGTIQGMLEMAGVRYVGAGVLASAVSMDKAYMKVVLAAAGLPLMASQTVTAREWYRDPDGITHRVAELGYPVFVKPARGGSSIGISKVHHAGELADAIEEAHRHDPKALVELSAEGAREIECGVLQALDGTPGDQPAGGDPDHRRPRVLRLRRQVPARGAHRARRPGRRSPTTSPTSVRELAARAFEAVGCEGLARVDFFVFPDGAVVVNEINTMPGFTPLSMFPRMWAATGLDYPALVDRLIQLALNRDTGLR